MTEDEMKNRISLALKDPILQQWFIDNLISLENENAELKEEMKAKQVVLNDFKSRVETVTNRLNKKASQLAKAKEIIKKFSVFVNNEIEYDPEHPQEHTDLWNKLCKEAEQFLKEVSE